MLVGLEGDDMLVGGDGSDEYQFGTFLSPFDGGYYIVTGKDVIIDKGGSSDTIVLGLGFAAPSAFRAANGDCRHQPA